jgi:hypothetical protein
MRWPVVGRERQETMQKIQSNLPSHRDLAQLGVTIIDAQNVWLRCMSCGEAFMPTPDSEGHLRAGYWKCPNGCNAHMRRSDLH